MKVIKRVAILGTGVMGRSIAITIARAGINVVLIGRSKSPALPSLLRREDLIDQKLTGKRPSSTELILLTNDLHQIAGADIVIESITEDFSGKVELLNQVSKIVNSSCTICSNTSSLDLEVLRQAALPEMTLSGLHFFNPATRLRIVEITESIGASSQDLNRLQELVAQIGYKAVLVPPIPGGIVNRLLFLMIGEAVKLVESGLRAEDVDETMKTAANHSMGPLELADFIGLDVCVRILENLRSRTNNPSYDVPKLLATLVSEGKVGRKSAEGFYHYGKRVAPNSDSSQ